MIRRKIEALMLMLAVASFGCEEEAPEADEEVEVAGEDDEAAEETAAAFNPATLLNNVMARLGGATMVAGNNLVVEVLPRASGDFQGLVYDAEGEVVQGAKLTVTAKGSDGSSKTVDLEWDADAEVYVGSAREADNDVEADIIATGPLSVEVEVDGADEPATGEVEVVAVAPTPVYGGDVLVAGDVSAEYVALPSGDIQLVAYGPDGLITGDADLKVEVPDTEGRSHEVDLVWNADASAYLGSVEEGVTLDTGAITFSAERNGVLRRTRVARAPIRVPTHEGDVVVVGGMTVELVPQPDNKIRAYVVGRDGTAVEADADAELSFAFGGAIDPIPASWDADAGAYVAVIPPEIDVSANRMRVRVRRSGRTHRGAIACPAGRALGVGWRARIESGEGGAIPPGQARMVLAGPDIRARFRGNAVPGGRTVMAGAMAEAPGAAVMVNVNGQAAAERLRGAAARARGAAVMVNVRAPMVNVQAPNVTVMTSGGGSAMSSAMASTRRRGGSAGASVMAGIMVGFGN